VIVDQRQLSIFLPPWPAEGFDFVYKRSRPKSRLRRSSPVHSRRQSAAKAIFRGVAVRVGIGMNAQKKSSGFSASIHIAISPRVSMRQGPQINGFFEVFAGLGAPSLTPSAPY